MIRTYAEKYFMEENYNCAESIVLAANDALQLGITPEERHMVCAFGGGMGCGRTCGALAGGLAILSRLRVTDRAHTAENFKQECAAYVKAFVKALGSADCKDIKPKYATKETRCLEAVLIAADVLEEQLKKYQN